MPGKAWHGVVMRGLVVSGMVSQGKESNHS